jgi:hypothetical protein
MRAPGLDPTPHSGDWNAKETFMPDGPNTKPPVFTESIPSQAGQTSALGSMSAPIIFADWIGTFGLANNGIVHIGLEAVRHMPVGGQSVADRVIVAHLRIPFATLAVLKQTIEKIELMAKPSGSTEKN